MEELPGTQWRNAHTYALTTIQEITTNRRGQLGPDPDPWINAMFSIGIWRRVYNRDTREIFCIEHWTRVDNLAPQEQIEWAKERVAHVRKEVAQAQRVLETTDKLNRSLRKRDLEHARRDVEEAQTELLKLSQRLGVVLDTNVRNIGVQPGEQLAMF
jgi:hypothetical protein